MTTGALIYTQLPGGVIYTNCWRLGKNKAGGSGRKMGEGKVFWVEGTVLSKDSGGRKEVSILGQKASGLANTK